MNKIFLHLCTPPLFNLLPSQLSWTALKMAFICYIRARNSCGTAVQRKKLYCEHLTALYCNIRQCTVLQCTTLHCTAMHYTAPYFVTPQCTALHCSTMQCPAVEETVSPQLRWPVTVRGRSRKPQPGSWRSQAVLSTETRGGDYTNQKW